MKASPAGRLRSVPLRSSPDSKACSGKHRNETDSGTSLVGLRRSNSKLHRPIFLSSIADRLLAALARALEGVSPPSVKALTNSSRPFVTLLHVCAFVAAIACPQPGL